jgi:RNA polymerase sigma-54 factor
VLTILQTFDPAGIGARSLQECLLLQIDRHDEGRLKDLMKQVIAPPFRGFSQETLGTKYRLNCSFPTYRYTLCATRFLSSTRNRGASLGETEGRNIQQITPDFIVDSSEDGSISFALNHGNLP